METSADQHVFQSPAYLGALDPDTVQVEWYAESPNGEAPLQQVMTRGERLADGNGHVYSAQAGMGERTMRQPEAQHAITRDQYDAVLRESV